MAQGDATATVGGITLLVRRVEERLLIAERPADQPRWFGDGEPLRRAREADVRDAVAL